MPVNNGEYQTNKLRHARCTRTGSHLSQLNIKKTRKDKAISFVRRPHKITAPKILNADKPLVNQLKARHASLTSFQKRATSPALEENGVSPSVLHQQHQVAHCPTSFLPSPRHLFVSRHLRQIPSKRHSLAQLLRQSSTKTVNTY